MRSTKYFFKVQGNDMAGDRIMNGDTVVIDTNSHYSSDDIVLVLISSKESPVLRRVSHDGNTYLLKSSSNNSGEYACSNEVLILGKMVEHLITF